jgi:hypothetical protein
VLLRHCSTVFGVQVPVDTDEFHVTTRFKQNCLHNPEMHTIMKMHGCHERTADAIVRLVLADLKDRNAV